MKFVELLGLVGDEPVFTSALLRAGPASDAELRLQLARWTKLGRILQLRRGLYTLAPPYRKVEPHPFLVANYLRRGSYVSLQSALARQGIIPEAVPVTTSVTTARRERMGTPMGGYSFRHLRQSYFFGYRQVEVARGQHAFVALPEKALLDLIYLTPRGDDESHLRELRLQAGEALDRTVLDGFADRFVGKKLRRAVATVTEILKEDVYEEV